MESKYYLLNGIKIHAMEEGPADGEIILFLHGFPEFWYSWRKQISYFSQKGYRVIAIDQRGYNLSEKPQKIKDYSMKNLVGDVIGLIGGFGKKKVFLVGHDWGGMVTWMIVHHNPEFIHKAVILNAPHPFVMKEVIGQRKLQILKSWYVIFFQFPFLPELVMRIFNFKMLRATLVRSSNKGTFSEIDLRSYVNAWKQKGSLNAMVNWYRASNPYGKITSKIVIPILLIWGKNDDFLVKESAEKSISLCGHGELKYINNATHWVHHEQSDHVNQIIEDFFK